jgi:hypothetical protein
MKNRNSKNNVKGEATFSIKQLSTCTLLVSLFMLGSVELNILFEVLSKTMMHQDCNPSLQLAPWPATPIHCVDQARRWFFGIK